MPQLDFDFYVQIEEISDRLEKIEKEIANLQTLGQNVKRYLLTDTSELSIPMFYARLSDQMKSLRNEMKMELSSLEKREKTYIDVLAQQTEFMRQQTEVMKQQSSFMNWIKYSAIFVPIAIACVPIIEILIKHLRGIP